MGKYYCKMTIYNRTRVSGIPDQHKSHPELIHTLTYPFDELNNQEFKNLRDYPLDAGSQKERAPNKALFT